MSQFQILKRSAVFAVLLAHTVAMAATAQSKATERESLKRALLSVIEGSPLKAARVSINIQSLDDGTQVFSRDADELLNPASNVKLFTSAAALTTLGTDYRFETEFLTDVELKDGKAKTLFVRGKADPTITTERLYGIVSDLVHTGLKEVNDIVLDDSWFDTDRFPPGYDQEYGDKAYLAPTGALSLNWNTIGVYLRPGESMGATASVELEPPSDYFVVTSEVTTGAKSQRRYTVTTGLDKDRIRQKIEAKGVVPLDKGNWSVWKRVESPPLYFGFTLKTLMVQKGIKVKGRIKTGTTPNSAKLLYTAQSETLDVVLKKLNKTSSNFIAEQLIKLMGAEVRGAPGTTANGIAVVEAFLARDVGIAPGTFMMRNGSGLNDANRFSASQVTRLLSKMWDRFPSAPEYMSSMPIGGKDGTLKFRFEGTDAVLRLRAKTGTLEGVSALSGYVQANSGERFVFSIIVNDFAGRASTVVQHMDAIGAAVAAVGSSQGPSAAVASMTQIPSVVGPFGELVARLQSYGSIAQKADRRNATFLRSALRTEKDPAIRALIADALYQSDPREPSTARAFVEAVSPGEDVWGRLQKAAHDSKMDLPLLNSLVELSLTGNADALSRMFEFVRASTADEMTYSMLAEQLALISHDAPQEMLAALKVAPVSDRTAALDALVHGWEKAGPAESPLWKTLKDAQAAQDPGMADFARELETGLRQRIPQNPAMPTTSPTAHGG